MLLSFLALLASDDRSSAAPQTQSAADRAALLAQMDCPDADIGHYSAAE